MPELATQRGFGEITRGPVSADSCLRKAARPVVFDPLRRNAGWRSRTESTPGTRSHLSFLGVKGNQLSQARRRLTLGAFQSSGQSLRPATIPQLIDGRSLILNYTFGIGTQNWKESKRVVYTSAAGPNAARGQHLKKRMVPLFCSVRAIRLDAFKPERTVALAALFTRCEPLLSLPQTYRAVPTGPYRE